MYFKRSATDADSEARLARGRNVVGAGSLSIFLGSDVGVAEGFGGD